MLVARLACLRTLPVAGLRPVLAQGTSALRSPAIPSWKPLLRQAQSYSTKARFGFRRGKTTKDQLKEAAFEPATDTAIKIDGMGRMKALTHRRHQARVKTAGPIFSRKTPPTRGSRTPAGGVLGPCVCVGAGKCMILFGGAAVGLGVLCYYGLGMWDQIIAAFTPGSS